MNILTKLDNFRKISQLWQVALTSALIDKTKMLEFGANFIEQMKWYGIPISFI